MKRVTFGLVLLAFLVGPAARVHAEDTENPYVKTRAMQKKESEEAERQYKRTLEATRAATTKPAQNDPWSNMRGTDASKSK
jgi:uncharacterized protein YxeA